MNDIETYLKQLDYALRELPPAKRDDTIAEIESHIEAGLAENDEPAKLLQELGPPQILAAKLHHLQWKHNWLYFGLATIPLLILDIISSSMPYYLIILGLPLSLTKLFALLFCLLLLGISMRTKSTLLIGWWFGLTVMRGYDAVFMPSSWIYLFLFLWIGLLGLYGRFLWRQRTDGFVISLSLIPYVWGSAIAFVPGTVWASDHLFRVMLTSTVSAVALTLTVLAAFIISDRKQRWQAMLIGTTICVAATLFVWHGSGLLFWLFLYFPITAGWFIENYDQLTFFKQRIKA